MEGGFNCVKTFARIERLLVVSHDRINIIIIQTK